MVDITKPNTILKNFDIGAEPVFMTYKGKKSHPTNCGGFLSILVMTLVSIFFVSRLYVLVSKSGDQFFQS